MTKMTAEDVAKNFEATAIGFDSLDMSVPAAMYRDAARFVREHLIETDEQRRERFEAWWRSENKYAAPDAFRRDADLKYAYGNVRAQFEAFQAALTWRGETKGDDA